MCCVTNTYQHPHYEREPKPKIIATLVGRTTDTMANCRYSVGIVLCVVSV